MCGAKLHLRAPLLTRVPGALVTYQVTFIADRFISLSRPSEMLPASTKQGAFLVEGSRWRSSISRLSMPGLPTISCLKEEEYSFYCRTGIRSETGSGLESVPVDKRFEEIEEGEKSQHPGNDPVRRSADPHPLLVPRCPRLVSAGTSTVPVRIAVSYLLRLRDTRWLEEGGPFITMRRRGSTLFA